MSDSSAMTATISEVPEVAQVKGGPSRKNVALFSTDLGGGGAERVMLTLAESFVQKGLSVDLVVSAARGALCGDVPCGVRLVDLNARRLIKSLQPLSRYLAHERPACMLSALSQANCVAIWARALCHSRTRLVVSEHSTLSVATANEEVWRYKKLPQLMRWSYPFADVLVAVSNGVADDLAKEIHYPRDRIQMIYNPVITPKMLALSHLPPNHPWFQPGEPPVILGVGRLMPPKDFPTLIRAFALLRRQRRARLVILGEGDERQSLLDLIGELNLGKEVALLGFVRNPYSFMRAASVFALSSAWEGLPTVLVEALACGTPVVATNCPSGPAEILENGTLGRLVPVGDVERLCTAMAESIGNPLQVPTQAMQRFTPENITRQYLSVLGIRDPRCANESLACTALRS